MDWLRVKDSKGDQGRNRNQEHNSIFCVATSTQLYVQRLLVLSSCFFPLKNDQMNGRQDYSKLPTVL